MDVQLHRRKAHRVCTPLGASSCTTYSYTASSNYRAQVLDANPAGYWPLSETSGAVANNVAARTTNENGTYTSVTFNATGALTGSPDKAATFSTASGSQVTLPTGMISSNRSLAVEA